MITRPVLAAFWLVLIFSMPASAQPPEGLEAQVQALQEAYRERGQDETTPVVLLGTFHFRGSETDTRSAGDAGMLSDERQAEIAEVLDLLEAWAPTKIAVEVKANNQEALDAAYQSYLAGERELNSGETHQLGFRLAERLGHDRIYAVDAEGRRFEQMADPYEMAAEQGQEWLANDPVSNGWNAMVDRTEKWIHTQKLRDQLLLENDPRVLRMGHSIYLTRTRAVSDGTEYPVADGFTSHWYNRNIRIFSNVLRMAEDSEAKADERILVIIGAGHVPIIRHLVENSGSLELVEVSDILGE